MRVRVHEFHQVFEGDCSKKFKMYDLFQVIQFKGNASKHQGNVSKHLTHFKHMKNV